MTRSPLTALVVAAVMLPPTNTASAAESAQPATLAQVLSRAADYIANLHQQLSSIVAEEIYVQRSAHEPRYWQIVGGVPRQTASPQKAALVVRTLKSDLLLVRTPAANDYIEFRDVIEVDGEPLRDRQERLTTLFLQPSPNWQRMQQIVEEGARYNVGNVVRNLNTPLRTLAFLSRGMQPSVRFRRGKFEQPTLGPTAVLPDRNPELFNVPASAWLIEFKEERRPTFIRRVDGSDFPAEGRFWIEPATGAVLVSELVMRNRTINATIVVSYQSEPLLGFRVPAAMDERYRMSGNEVEGFARYGHFRQFRVTTSEVIGKPPGE